MTTFPLISIIIPSLNHGQYIEQTITSILAQPYPRKEIIIIDGGSTDETPQIVEKYAASIRHYISEPDNGQTDAINKGFRLAQGDILAWLNSDDIYWPGIFSKVVRTIGDTAEPRLVYGGCLRFTEGTPNTYGRLPAPFSAERLTYYNYIDQSSTFWTRSLWERIGELNTSYTYVLDWEWFVRASRICQFTPLPEFLSLFRFHEGHKTSSGGAARRAEIVNVVDTYAADAWRNAYHDVFHRFEPLKQCLDNPVRWRKHRLRMLLYPLYLKHGKRRIETIISMFV